MTRAAFAALLAVLVAPFGMAQEKLTVEGPSPGTVRLGDVARVVVSVEGKGANPRPPQPPEVPGLRIEVSAPNQSTYQFYDGRTLIERISVQYQILLKPLREGAFVVPAFAMWTGSGEQTVRELRLEARKDLRGQDLGFLDVRVEPQRVYVHEPIRIHVEFGVQQGLRLVQGRLPNSAPYNGQPFYDVEVQAPWLADFPGGEPLEAPSPPGDQRYVMADSKSVRLVGYQAGYERNGQAFHRFSFDLAYLPTRIGRIDLSAPQLRYDVVVREGQSDVFGRSIGGRTENFFVYGEPVSLEVLPIPEAGRPVPYFGAVGRFAIEAALDRETVKVGSSVKLTLTVRGQGNLEFLRLPELDDLPGFHKLGQAQTRRDADKVVVTYDLTPLTTDVKAVPPIAWNFFDTTPGVEKFVAVTTNELPLVVQPPTQGETLAPLPDAAARPVTPGVDDVYDLPALDGALTPTAAPPRWLGWLAVLGPWLLTLVGWAFVRGLRRRAADTEGLRARGARRECLRQLRAGGDPVAALADYLGSRLGVPGAAVIAADLAPRLVAAGLGEDDARAAAAAIDQGTAARYGGGAPLAAAQVEALVDRLEAKTFGVHGWLPFVLWAALAFAGGTGHASAQTQTPPTLPAPTVGATGGAGDVARAVAAYRAGDYAAAQAGFARAWDATGDRRLMQARGNCYYRLGDLPRARWAYEAARTDAPRDAELLANLRLVRRQLEVDEADTGFSAELDALRRTLTTGELLLLSAASMLVAALCLVLGWRRGLLRWLGVLALLPGVLFALELLWLRPAQPPQAIALQKLSLVAEPRADLPAIATVRPGVALTLRGGDQGAFVRVTVGERSGYVPREQVAIVP